MSDASQVIVTGSIVTSPERMDELIGAALAHVRRSRTEPGCLEHGVYRDVEDPDRLFFFERWTDRVSLDAHFSVTGSGEFLAAVSTLAVGRPTLEIRTVTGDDA